MCEKLDHFKNVLFEFKHTCHYKECSRNLAFITILMLLLLSGGIFLLLHLNIGNLILVKTYIVILLTGFIIFYIRLLIFFYNTFIYTSIKMRDIYQKNDMLSDKDTLLYSDSLKTIIDLLDSSTEREYSSKLLQKQAELDAMKNQINPHFLYNTLDTIRGYALLEEAPLTSDMIEILSRLFRYSISQKNDLIPIEQEIGILNDYIKIHQYRLNSHITLLQYTDPDLEDIMSYKIPKLILQPFIENALKHGMNENERNFTITLHIYATQSRLVISISDNGCGMDTAKLAELNHKLADTKATSQSLTLRSRKRGTGIAIVNVNSRIKLIFGDEYGVIVYSTLGIGSEFQITLPYNGV